jgi:hypothetical protein
MSWKRASMQRVLQEAPLFITPIARLSFLFYGFVGLQNAFSRCRTMGSEVKNVRYIEWFVMLRKQFHLCENLVLETLPVTAHRPNWQSFSISVRNQS